MTQGYALAHFAKSVVIAGRCFGDTDHRLERSRGRWFRQIRRKCPEPPREWRVCCHRTARDR